MFQLYSADIICQRLVKTSLTKLSIVDNCSIYFRGAWQTLSLWCSKLRYYIVFYFWKEFFDYRHQFCSLSILNYCYFSTILLPTSACPQPLSFPQCNLQPPIRHVLCFHLPLYLMPVLFFSVTTFFIFQSSCCLPSSPFCGPATYLH